MPTEPNNLRTKSKNFLLVVYSLFARIIVVFSLSLTLKVCAQIYNHNEYK